MLKEFVGFLKEYGIIGLAMAVIIGGKLNDLVSSVVNDLVVPLLLRPALQAARRRHPAAQRRRRALRQGAGRRHRLPDRRAARLRVREVRAQGREGRQTLNARVDTPSGPVRR
jgi:hypothetical protein